MILVHLSLHQHRAPIWVGGKEAISILGVHRVNFVLVASDISQQFKQKVVQRRKIPLPDSSTSSNPTSSAFKVILNSTCLCFWLISLKRAENDGEEVIRISPISFFTGSTCSDKVCANDLFETEEGCGIYFTGSGGVWWVQSV